jgi:hypothetical protein
LRSPRGSAREKATPSHAASRNISTRSPRRFRFSDRIVLLAIAALLSLPMPPSTSGAQALKVPRVVQLCIMTSENTCRSPLVATFQDVQGVGTIAVQEAVDFVD